MALGETAPQKTAPVSRGWQEATVWRAALPSLAAGAALSVVTLAVCLVFWPGHVDPDTLDEYNQVATGRIGGWHAPVLVAIWRVAYLIGLRSPGWVLAGSVLTLLVGAYLLLRTRLARPWAVVGAAACIWFPPVMAWDVQVGIDAWFAALAVVGFGCVARATATSGRARVAYLAVAVVAAFLVGCTRLTALPVSFLMLTGVCLVAARGRWPGWRYGLGSVACAGASTVIVALLVTGIDDAVLHTYQPSAAQGTYIYDLAALSRAEGVVALPADVYPGQLLDPLKQLSSTTTADLLEFAQPPLIPGFPLHGARYASLQHAWVQAVERHPGAYLHERFRFALRLLAIDAPAVYPHEIGPPPPGSLYAFAHPELHRAVMRYVSEFTDAVQLESPWAYMVVLIMSLAWFACRRTAVARIQSLFALGLLVYVGVMVFALPSAIYRYVYPVVCGSIILGLIVAVEVATALVTSRRRLTSTTRTIGADAVPVRQD
jgi:hypothetical protein